jgi:diguanylate cyclase (GGDEF)-like protein/PAS domain S-box-containing protein
MQILVVEDSPVYRQLLVSHLQEWSFPFTIAKNGTEAWTLLQRSDCPRLVLLSWVLPDIDGVELCRRIRLAGSGNSYSYIILLTGKDGKKNMLEAMQAGADDYLVKPFDQLELKARLLVGMRIVGLNEELVSARESMRYTTEKQLHLRSAALEAAANGIMITDRHGTIVWVNHAFTGMTGYSKEEALGKNPRLLKSGEQPEGYYAKLWSTISSGKVWQGEIVNRRKDGTTNTEEMTITPVTQDLGSMTDTYFIAIKQDITERKRAEEELYRSRQMLQSTLDTIPQRVFWKDRNSTYLGCNRAFATDAGLNNPAEIIGKSDFELAWSGTADRYRADDKRVMEKGSAKLNFDETQSRPDGSLLWLRTNKLPLHDREGKVTGIIGTYEDITERKQAEQALRTSEKRYRLLFERNLAGVFRTTVEGRLLECNHAAARMFGYDSPEEVLALPVTSLYHTASDREAFLRKLKSEKSLTNHEMKLRRKNGDSTCLIGNMSLVDDNSGVGRIIEGTLVDITERKVAEERVQFLAYYDALTGLPNRTLLQDRLTKALASARRQKCKVALLFLDLDRFKIINDSLGHSFGDLLLQEVAERLKRFAREQDTVARLGGDEFLIVLTALKDVGDAAVAAERIMNAMTTACVIQCRSLSIGCSLGISIFPEHGTDGETLIKNADTAMYCAKDGGRNNFQFFTADMNAQAVERLTLENSLRLALGREELFLVYQPQMDIATGRITGLEALLRWQHPELGLVPPDKFIRIAENSGLIMPIGEWVLRTACRQARKWQDEGLPAVPVAVNVSAVQFRQEDFCEVIRRVLHETGLAPQYLELELTESLLLSNADVTLSVLQELNAMGLTLAIDDFGTGYSSLSYLKQFPVSKLKIDRSFVRDIAVNPDDAAITTAIISMAKSLHLKVIAEGVEDEAQMSFLRAHQCGEIQGYYFSKPLAVDKVADKLRGTAVHALSANHGV